MAAEFRPRADGFGEQFVRGPMIITNLVEAMISGQPYPIKGLVIYAVNLFHALPNPQRTKEALQNLDFVVAIDVFPQEYTDWADVILPECTYLERYDPLLAMASKQPYVLLRQPVVEPLYESKPGWWIARELGVRLGLAKFFPWEDYEEVLAWELKAIGSSMEEMRELGVLHQKVGRPYLSDWEGQEDSPFPTESGKIQLYSQELADFDLDPLPTYEPVEEVPTGYYRLLYGRSAVHSFSRTANNVWLSEQVPENDVWINPQVAQELGVEEGEYVILENLDGVQSDPIRARVTSAIRADCVYMVHGFGHHAAGLRTAHGKGASDAVLQTRLPKDPVCGSVGLRVNGVRILKGGAA